MRAKVYGSTLGWKSSSFNITFAISTGMSSSLPFPLSFTIHCYLVALFKKTIGKRKQNNFRGFLDDVIV